MRGGVLMTGNIEEMRNLKRHPYTAAWLVIGTFCAFAWTIKDAFL